MKKKLSFICPHCKKEQTSLFESQTGSQIYEYDSDSRQWDIEFDFEGEHDSWNCPDCHQELDLEQLRNVLPKEVLDDLGYQK